MNSPTELRRFTTNGGTSDETDFRALGTFRDV